MKTLILHGHQGTAQAVYMLVDALLRERNVRGIALAQTIDIDHDTADYLRQAGGELWFCAPDRTFRKLGDPDSDRYLLASTVEPLAGLAIAALGEFLAKAQVQA